MFFNLTKICKKSILIAKDCMLFFIFQGNNRRYFYMEIDENKSNKRKETMNIRLNAKLKKKVDR